MDIWKCKNLGINVHNDSTANLRNNLEPKIEEFNNCLKQWQPRKLTLMGKITVVKTFALPKLVYPLTVLKNPAVETLDEIKKSIFKFIWNGKPDQVKRIVNEYEDGGMKLTV